MSKCNEKNKIDLCANRIMSSVCDPKKLDLQTVQFGPEVPKLDPFLNWNRDSN